MTPSEGELNKIPDRELKGVIMSTFKEEKKLLG